MPKISRIRKQIRSSPWFTDRIQLQDSPLVSLVRTGGLENPNNICFINSSLQCLIHCEPFAQVMLHNDHRQVSSHGFCFLCAVRRISKDMLQNKKEVGSAHKLSTKCQELSPIFEVGAQQDAHEFLTSLLTKMVIEEEHGCGTPYDKAHDNEDEKKKSLIDQLFRFRTKKTITCSKCGTKSETEEVCNSLLLQPTKENKESIKTIDEALRYFFGYEVLDGENAYSCEKCNELVKATKRLSLMEGPNVLVISLGRFSVAFDKNWQPIFKKEANFIKYTERLDVTPYMHDMTPEEELNFGGHQYRLSSFISHIGEKIHGGHYIANVFLPSHSKTAQAGGWWQKNDSHVSQVGFEKDTTVYLLFYTREDLQPHFLTGPRKKKESKKIATGSFIDRSRSSHYSKDNARNGEEQKQELRRIFLFPKLDVPRKSKWYPFEDEAVEVDNQIPETDAFEEIELSIGNDDDLIIEEIYEAESET